VRKSHALSKGDLRMAEEDSGNTGDINAIYAAANELPSDDPLRAAVNQPASTPQPAAAAQPQTRTQPLGAAANTSANPVATQPQIQPQPAPATRIVIINDGKKLRVPSLIGLPVRKVIEQAAAAGLEVEISGNGSVREQAPAAGTMVAPGTKIVVRCGR
jgi:cell division protein FtsI (penicillin-binding protein 3)